MIRTSAILAVALGAAACAPRPVATAAEQPACALVTFPVNERIGAWSVDKFVGRYSRADSSLAVRRDEHRFLVEGWTLGRRELTAPDVGSWTWHDGCGVRYDFTLPPDGPGAWLKVTMPDGTMGDWKRFP